MRLGLEHSIGVGVRLLLVRPEVVLESPLWRHGQDTTWLWSQQQCGRTERLFVRLHLPLKVLLHVFSSQLKNNAVMSRRIC